METLNYARNGEDYLLLLYRNILNGYSDLLCVKDLANIFAVSKQTVYKEIRNGKFGVPIRVGRALMIPKLQLIRNIIDN
jgi:predicted DNA-binding protein YlxM (UPF0122 family)